MISNFTLEELKEANQIIGYHPEEHFSCGWWITGESGALNLMYKTEDRCIYICWLKDFEHFQRLWKELTVKPY